MRLSEIVMIILWRAGINRLARHLFTRHKRFVLVFHGVAPQRYPHLPHSVQPHHTTKELRQTLGWLQPRFPFLTPEQFFAGIHPGVLLTFDDGLANNYDYALPILADFAAPAIFFVSTQHVCQPTNWLAFNRQRAVGLPAAIAHTFFDGLSMQQLRQCANHPLITIGGHTVSHPFLTQCDNEQLWQELVECRHTLQTLTGQSIDTFAYPTNDYNKRVAQATQKAGYRAAFAVDSRQQGLPAYEIPRVGLYHAQPAYLSTKLNGLYRRPLGKEITTWGN